MENTLTHVSHGGWTEAETARLWQEIEGANETGAPLRDVFERMGRVLGRKPNSVRNYYYMQLRSRGDGKLRRATPFETFTEEEIRALLRAVLTARGRGQSVRSCVSDLAGGDRTLMLRYQNKYRSVLRKKPGLVDSVCRELTAEGVPVPAQPVSITLRPIFSEDNTPDLPEEDPDVRQVLRGLKSLAERAARGSTPESDRLKVQRDLLMMRLEDLQLAARDLIADCKAFLGAQEAERAQALPSFCEALAGHTAKLESLAE